MKHIRSMTIGCLVSLLALGWVHTGAAQIPRKAPANPAFLKQMELRAQPAFQPRTADGHPLGYLPGPVNLEHLRGQRTAAAQKTLGALPSSYDLRPLGKLTAIRDQNPWGTCWAFATYSSMESCLLTGETRDFSENNLVNRAGFDNGYDDGGNAYMSMAYLARWDGPVNESDDPYPNPGHSPSNLTPQKHVQEALAVPLKSSALDNDEIKQAVMTYGAMYIGMCYDDDSYSATYASHYYDGTNSANHAVAIVGWDDSFPIGHFSHAAPGNGAFLVRNSWGTNWGDAGYFYCSYYDSKMGYDENYVFNSAEPTTNFSSIYQYDPLGWVYSMGYSSTNAWGANIFQATSARPLRAVGFYAVDVNLRYEIFVYTNVIATNPATGTLATHQTGVQAYAGYHTVMLNTPVDLTAGQHFSVIVRFTASTSGYPVPVEDVSIGYSSAARSAPNQSFMSESGAAWDDITQWFSNANVCIKAFVGSGSTANPAAVTDTGDYDADGVSDLAVQEPATGIWFFRTSSGGYATLGYYAAPFAVASYIALTGDLDGDARADMVAYDQSNGAWYFRQSGGGSYLTTTNLSMPFGGPGFLPVCGDFDHDGFSDLAAYQQSTGYWFFRMSGSGYQSLTFFELPFGGPGYYPVCGDFDHDGISDLVAYEAATGYWYFRMSGGGYQTLTVFGLPFGGSGYIPVCGDFDRDGISDLAVYERPTGYWYFRLSGGGYGTLTVFTTPFGGPGYFPVP